MIPDGLPPEVRVLTTRLTRGTIRPSARAADAKGRRMRPAPTGWPVELRRGPQGREAREVEGP